MNETIVSLFEEHASNKPDKTAIVSGEKALTYGRLNAVSNQYAHLLSSLVEKGDRIGICFAEEPSAILVSILAILKLGCVYVPIDPKNPSERIDYLIQSSNPRIIIGDSTTKDLMDRYRQFVLFKNEISETIGNVAVSNPGVKIKEADPAYIIFTSGSTGMPKGVMVSHGNLLCAYLAWEKSYDLKNIQCHLQVVSYSFDVFSGDWIRALCSGEKLVMCPENISKNPPRLYDLIERNKVQCAEFLPVLLRGLFNYMEQHSLLLASMKLLVCGSDKWFITEYFNFKKFLPPDGRLINSYGTSETTIDTSYFEFTEQNLFLAEEAIQVPIGKPFPGMKLILLDENVNEVKKGVVGEIYIGGSGVSLGYINAPELNKKKFVKIPGEKGMYFRTGDYGKVLSSGDIEFIGRRDNQVKFHGKRISLTEIENILATHFPISDSAVLVVEQEKEQTMIAFIVPKDKNNKTTLADSLSTALLQYIPEYMLPDQYMIISSLPTNLNGKIDKKALLDNFQNNLYGQK